ncbi:metabotropic glutamate receptor 4-like [Tubulanus polymorphus]|uniref:metabotropic glutamate receptor 4-like n=1 Tax=Tubulanus polymorphus TaxID=672921 RepID=UPI003DA60C2E
MTSLRSIVAFVSMAMLGVVWSIRVPGLPDKQYARLGDINLGGIFPIQGYSSSKPCGDALRNTAIMQYIEAMVYAVELMNNRTDILPNVTLGFIILDSCIKDMTAMGQALHFVPRDGANATTTGQSDGTRHYFPVKGVVGAMKSSSSSLVAKLLGQFHVPQISYSSTADELSRKDEYPYFLRLVPPDKFQVRAMMDILTRFNWTYVSVVYTAGTYGENAFKSLSDLTDLRGSCIAYSARVYEDTTVKQYDTIVDRLLEVKAARAVIVFAGPTNAKGLFAAVLRKNVTGHFIWIGSDAWSARVNQMSGLEEAIHGALHVLPISVNVPDFNRYFLTLNPTNRMSNPWFREFWEMQFGCSWIVGGGERPPCNETGPLLPGHVRPMTSIAPVIDSVETFARALDSLIRDRCANTTDRAALVACIDGPSLLEYLKNTTFRGLTGDILFNEESDLMGTYAIEQFVRGESLRAGALYHKQKVALWYARENTMYWNGSEVKWKPFRPITPPGGDENDVLIPESVCSKPCEPGHFYLPRELSCCWECRACAVNEIVVNESTCEPCAKLHWPNQTSFLECQPIEPYFMETDDAAFYTLAMSAVVGIILTLVTTIVYILKRKEKLIMASSRELSHLMLIGVFIGYVTVFLLVVKPTVISCRAAYFGFSLGFTWVYAPLLTKTSRIYIIFEYSKKAMKAPPLVGQKFQVFIASFIITIQIIISVISTAITPPDVILRMPVSVINYVEMSCAIPFEGLCAFLLYNLILVTMCSFYAFKTRKVPDNFNESRFIALCVYTTLVIWLAFISTYFTTTKAYYQIILLSLALIFNGTVTLVFLFLPKIYAVLYVETANQKVKFNRPDSSIQPQTAPPSGYPGPLVSVGPTGSGSSNPHTARGSANPAPPRPATAEVVSTSADLSTIYAG